jgi:hypothetical protein
MRKLISFVLANALLGAGIFILARKMDGSPTMVLMLQGGGIFARSRTCCMALGRFHRAVVAPGRSRPRH